jgi:hypothetical protein
MSEEIINDQTTTPAPPAEMPVPDARPSAQAIGAVVRDSNNRQRANRLNAKKSTGPKTTEGKRRSSLNATRHAILSQVIHLPEEEMAAYTAYCEHFVE